MATVTIKLEGEALEKVEMLEGEEKNFSRRVGAPSFKGLIGIFRRLDEIQPTEVFGGAGPRLPTNRPPLKMTRVSPRTA